MQMQPISNSTAQTISLDHKQSPAKAVREQLATRNDLAGQPFGQLVSLIARGLNLPAPPAVPSTTDSTVTSSTATTA